MRGVAPVRRSGHDVNGTSGSVQAVVDRLRSLTDPFGHEVSERVQAAVVMLSDGDWRRFVDRAELAQRDWRDVLVAAGLADHDWREPLDEYLGRP